MNSPLRILHLEDDGKDAEIIQGVLETGGIPCQVTRVETRDDFIAALEGCGFDVILADFSLPSFDGLSALRLTLEKCPDVPFIFVSGTLGEEVAIDAVKTGAMDYVPKERLSRIVSSVHRALRDAGDRAERKQAEQQLRRSEAFLAEGQRISHTGSWGWVLSSGKVTWSEEQYRMLGFERGKAEPSVELFLTAVHPEDRSRVRHDLEEATSAKQAYAINYRVVLPGGSIRHLCSVGRPLATEAGAVGEYIGTTADITERVRAEAALLARQEMLDLAQKAARAVAFEWRMGAGEGEKRPWPELDAMYGLAPGTYDGTFEAWKELVHPEDRAAVKDAMSHANESGELAAEYRVVHPDGGVRWLQAKGRIFADDQGGPARVVGFMLDVTERRQAEEELRRLESRLRQAQRLEAMGTLAGGIAHDFNNILGAILGYGERALGDAPRNTRLHRDLESILAAGERGRALVDRVLTFSRGGAGERVAVHVEDVVREALDVVVAKLPQGIAIEATLQAGRAAINGDPTEVHQVVMNLATNAVQAMPSGGTLRVSLTTARVDAARVATIGTIGAGDYLVLEVADNGTGIRPEILDRIFDPFFTTKEVSVGNGLGLSLVHGIVMEAGGAIDLASTVGSGSTFTVYLPRAGDASDDLEDAGQAAPQGGGQRVLFVDDEEPLVKLATETLEELGYAPVGFTSSAAALEAFRADPRGFAAVITDERMPGMSGSALIRAVRGIRRSVPIVLVSGNVGGMVTTRAYNAGADEVLKKPLSARELATSLARVLQV
jgi:signal transduction histidine kinase/DNA-binding response OmpR family regulator